MKKITDLSTQKVMATIVKWGTQVVFLISIIILSYLSFVDTFKVKPNLKNIGILSIVSAVLSWLVWDSSYTSTYEKTMSKDRLNEEYSVHRRFYHARRGWKYNDLQTYIRNYNRNFLEQWKIDVEDITGRSFENIEAEPYKGHDHKFLIWRVKHHVYPKSGIKTPKDLQYVLSVNSNDGKKIKVHKAETLHSVYRIKKIFSAATSMLFAASVTTTFIQDGWRSAIFTLIMSITFLFFSYFFGSLQGAKGGRIKLATAEEVSELLEEWKNEAPSEEPYVQHQVAIEEHEVVSLPVHKETTEPELHSTVIEIN